MRTTNPLLLAPVLLAALGCEVEQAVATNNDDGGSSDELRILREDSCTRLCGLEQECGEHGYPYTGLVNCREICEAELVSIAAYSRACAAATPQLLDCLLRAPCPMLTSEDPFATVAGCETVFEDWVSLECESNISNSAITGALVQCGAISSGGTTPGGQCSTTMEDCPDAIRYSANCVPIGDGYRCTCERLTVEGLETSTIDVANAGCPAAVDSPTELSALCGWFVEP